MGKCFSYFLESMWCWFLYLPLGSMKIQYTITGWYFENDLQTCFFGCLLIWNDIEREIYSLVFYKWYIVLGLRGGQVGAKQYKPSVRVKLKSNALSSFMGNNQLCKLAVVALVSCEYKTTLDAAIMGVHSLWNDSGLDSRRLEQWWASRVPRNTGVPWENLLEHLLEHQWVPWENFSLSLLTESRFETVFNRFR